MIISSSHAVVLGSYLKVTLHIAFTEKEIQLHYRSLLMEELSHNRFLLNIRNMFYINTSLAGLNHL